MYALSLLSFALARAMLAVTAICRLIALSFATALTGCATSGFSVSSDTAIIVGHTTLGYAFTVRSPIRVTDLGLYDHYSVDGFNDQHAVAIWTSTGTQLVQTTIPAGTSAKLIDNFRYVPIAPFILAPGTYTIGASTSTKISHPQGVWDFFLVDSTITSAYEVSYLGPRSTYFGEGFRFPSGNNFRDSGNLVYRHRPYDLGFFGPNFWFTCGDPTQAPTLCRPKISPWKTWKPRATILGLGP